jgi:hypothetical protein
VVVAVMLVPLRPSGQRLLDGVLDTIRRSGDTLDDVLRDVFDAVHEPAQTASALGPLLAHIN